MNSGKFIETGPCKWFTATIKYWNIKNSETWKCMILTYSYCSTQITCTYNGVTGTVFCLKGTAVGSQMVKTLRSMLIRYQSKTKVLDWYLINTDLMVLAIWDWTCRWLWKTLPENISHSRNFLSLFYRCLNNRTCISKQHSFCSYFLIHMSPSESLTFNTLHHCEILCSNSLIIWSTCNLYLMFNTLTPNRDNQLWLEWYTQHLILNNAPTYQR